jgi:hypothetical protein
MEEAHQQKRNCPVSQLPDMGARRNKLFRSYKVPQMRRKPPDERVLLEEG